MNAIKLLRTMHADAKMRFRLILGSDNPQEAATMWQQLQPVLKLHEQMEDTYLYGPLQKQLLPGSVLGDYEQQHHADVALVDGLIQGTAELKAGTPPWRMQVAQINDLLARHIMDEEGQIFPRIEQVWDGERLEQAGQKMAAMQAGAPVVDLPEKAKALVDKAKDAISDIRS